MQFDAVRQRAEGSFPAAVVRRFFELELLDRSFGLAAQAFVSLLPLLIVIVSVFSTDGGAVIANQMSDRFGLDDAARLAIRALFDSSDDVRTISWLAIIMSLISAFALSRRLSRVYGSIFGMPGMQRQEVWRGLVWIVLQFILFAVASTLRELGRSGGILLTLIAVAGLLVVWFGADVAGLRLLVPKITRALLIPSAVVTGAGRLAATVWAAIYMPATLSNQAAQYGPIGVTFALFTLILAYIVVYLAGPLLVSTWNLWRAERTGEPSLAK